MPRRSFKGLDFPKQHLRPCPVHPGSQGTVTDLRRCLDCSRAYKRALNKFPSTKSRYAFCTGSAKQRGMEFALTLEQYERIVTQPCVYAITVDSAIRPGVDRKDSALGYTLENSQSCCHHHNQFKSNILTHE